MNDLIRKGESRCFVFFQDHIEKVKAIIKEIDEFEFEYMPEDWITLWDGHYDDRVYNGKFDINIVRLYTECGKKGISIIIVSTNQPEEVCQW